MNTRKLGSLLVLVFITVMAIGQNYGPEKVKNFDIKDLKKKKLYIPVIDKFPNPLIDMSKMEGFDTDRKIDEEFARRVDEAIRLSSFDLIEEYEVLKFGKDRIKKEKTKDAIVMYFEKDFYSNFYVYLAVAEPKWEVIATAPVNDLSLVTIDDLKLMFNMITYSMMLAAEYYGDDAKPLYRNHDFRYKENIDKFTDNLKGKTFYVPEFDKKVRKYKKKNDKLSDYLKEEWKLSSYQLASEAEIAEKVKSTEGIYFKKIPIKTANTQLTYDYYLVLTTTNNDVLYAFMGFSELSKGNLKFMQTHLEEWFFYFMDNKKRNEFQRQKEKENQPPPAKKETPSNKKGASNKEGDKKKK
jgi:hypothetical protein